jgi:hypothetical protein
MLDAIAPVAPAMVILAAELHVFAPYTFGRPVGTPSRNQEKELSH